jgi:hypothetical protein
MRSLEMIDFVKTGDFMNGKITLLLLLALLWGGCATQGQRAENLLAIDPVALSNPELVEYFQRLNGELAHEKRLARKRQSVRAEDEVRSELLWQRWNEVRGEMGRRELLP